MTSRRLADHIRRAVGGPMWHGPAVAGVLDGVTATQAAAHPVPGAHSIWELVLHLSVWAEIAGARLRGAALAYPPPEEDWPAPASTAEAAWTAAVERLAAAYDALANQVEALSPDELRATVTGQDHPVWAMLHGVAEHACYHGGQIPLLKRALATSAPVVTGAPEAAPQTSQASPAVRALASDDAAEWLRMRHALLPSDDHAHEIAQYLGGDVAFAVFVHPRAAGGLGGFLEVGLRAYAEGCVTSPVAYIEAWYVDEELRGQGIGRELVRAAEDWARVRGLTEIASDALIDNHVSIAAHRAVGYEEVERIACFRRSLQL
jgi:aminoglycoside 6'-N-acetyltransferase I